jgi:hypothetical protein
MSEILTKTVVCLGACEPKCGHCFEQIEVPLTAEEISQREADVLAEVERKAAEDAAAEVMATIKASAKAKLMAGEPLTAEEADTLVI